MIREFEVDQTVGMTFEPSQLIEYGDAIDLTQGGGGPAAQPDGAVYNS